MTITTTSAPAASVSAAYSLTLTAAGGTGTFTWTLISGSLPAGLSLSSGGVISGTPTAAATSNFTVKVVSGTVNATQALSIVVSAATSSGTSPVLVATVTLPNAIVGTAYSQTLLAYGGSGSITWSILTGALPAGLSLSTSGVISGTPTVATTSTFTVLATSGLATAAQGLNITVQATPTPAVVITTAALAGATSNASYSQTLVATGGTGAYIWTVTAGTLPTGLTLSAAGVLSGTPTIAGTSNFTVQVASGSATATKALSVVVASPVLTVTTLSLSSVPVGATYSNALIATGGTGGNVWVVLSGAPPTGLTLSSAGVLSGTPVVAATFNFTVQVTSGVQVATQALSMTITVPGPIVIVTASLLPDAPLTVNYNATLTASGGTGTYGWSLIGGALPAGITLSVTGALSGTPTVAGTSTFTLQVLSGAATASQVFNILVDPLLALTTASLPSDSAGQAYSQTLAATGGTGVYTWTVSSGTLPTGLTMSTGGVITGTPTVAGTYNFNAKVTSGTQFAVHSYSLIINSAAPVVVTTTQLPGAIASSLYSQALAASGGTGVYTWSLTAGSLPLGMSMSTAGVISGTPGSTGTSNFSVQASSAGQTATQALSITVTANGVLVITTQSVPDSKINVAYTYPLLDAGGAGLSTWTVIAGALPPGVTLLANGTISGTPTHTGAFAFTAQSTNGALTAAKAFTLNVTP